MSPMLLTALLVASMCLSSADAAQLTVPYFGTPDAVVDAMLRLANITQDSVVMDLGCGDGRLPHEAILRGAKRAICVDLNENLIARARERGKQLLPATNHMRDLVDYRIQDFFETDVTGVNTVLLYLEPVTLSKVEEYLFQHLAPGAIVVTHDYPLDNGRFGAPQVQWFSDKPFPEKLEICDSTDALIYRYQRPGGRVETEERLSNAAVGGEGDDSDSKQKHSSSIQEEGELYTKEKKEKDRVTPEFFFFDLQTVQHELTVPKSTKPSSTTAGRMGVSATSTYQYTVTLPFSYHPTRATTHPHLLQYGTTLRPPTRTTIAQLFAQQEQAMAIEGLTLIHQHTTSSTTPKTKSHREDDDEAVASPQSMSIMVENDRVAGLWFQNLTSRSDAHVRFEAFPIEIEKGWKAFAAGDSFRKPPPGRVVKHTNTYENFSLKDIPSPCTFVLRVKVAWRLTGVQWSIKQSFRGETDSSEL